MIFNFYGNPFYHYAPISILIAHVLGFGEKKYSSIFAINVVFLSWFLLEG
jgi:hypothetical protein